MSKFADFSHHEHNSPRPHAELIRVAADAVGEVPLPILRDLTNTVLAVHHHATRASMAHALECGFDGVVAISDDPKSTISKIEMIIDGTWTFESEPSLRELSLIRRMLARELVLGDTDDEQLVDLMGTGLPDEDIAMLIDWTIQQVRNRIESLLTDNDLAYRRQLAVIRAASLKVPDFF